ncbi:MAG: hypothetical protein P1P90_05800 [Patescibacteria group bacterium]|nr:hypothetical protein [Patescibacteria group bacterium]
MNKKLLIITISLILLFGSLIYLLSPILFQEGNPWPQINGIVKLTFTELEISKLSDKDNKYITKSKNGVEVVKAHMKDKGYDFIEQIGSGYLFKSSTGEGAVATQKYYSRFYSLWNVVENTDVGVDSIDPSDKLPIEQPTIAEELKECLPKSDIASHERCNELLATIRNYDDCVRAGFSIMKSNPPQCSVVDGRIFTDETNSTWDVVLTTLDNCEVKSVFQTHDKLVTLELKNGNLITAYEPQIDDVMVVVAGLKGKCGDIILATE